MLEFNIPFQLQETDSLIYYKNQEMVPVYKSKYNIKDGAFQILSELSGCHLLSVTEHIIIMITKNNYIYNSY